MNKLRELTYRKKNNYLLIGAGVFLVLIYLLAFHRTIGLSVDNGILEEQLERARRAPNDIRYYEQQLLRYENKLGAYAQDSVINQEYALAVISEYCNNHGLQLHRFPDAIPADEEGFQLLTNAIEVSGSFTGLLRLVYHLEREQRVGRVTAVCFQSEKDRRTKRVTLTAVIYLQNVKIEKNEKATSV